jgi:hypothetical protein
MNAHFFDFAKQNQKNGHSFKIFLGGVSRQGSFETASLKSPFCRHASNVRCITNPLLPVCNLIMSYNFESKGPGRLSILVAVKASPVPKGSTLCHLGKTCPRHKCCLNAGTSHNLSLCLSCPIIFCLETAGRLATLAAVSACPMQEALKGLKGRHTSARGAAPRKQAHNPSSQRPEGPTYVSEGLHPSLTYAGPSGL